MRGRDDTYISNMLHKGTDPCQLQSVAVEVAGINFVYADAAIDRRLQTHIHFDRQPGSPGQCGGLC